VLVGERSDENTSETDIVSRRQSIITTILFTDNIEVFYVAGVIASRSQLNAIHRTLISVSNRLTDEHEGSNTFQVAQFFSPSCRAAKRKEIWDLYASTVLRLVNDKDIHYCKDSQSHLSNAVLLFVAIPAVIVSIGGDSLSNIFFSTYSSSLIMGFILEHRMFTCTVSLLGL
jgi:hypothetical protein